MEDNSTRRRSITVTAFVFAALAIVAVPLVASRVFDAGGRTHTFVVPLGTADRVAAGEDVTVIPDDLRLRMSDRLVVINEDSTTHRIASIVVGAGERVETRVSEAVTLTGFCSLHPSGQIAIEIDGTVDG